MQWDVCRECGCGVYPAYPLLSPTIGSWLTHDAGMFADLRRLITTCGRCPTGQPPASSTTDTHGWLRRQEKQHAPGGKRMPGLPALPLSMYSWLHGLLCLRVYWAVHAYCGWLHYSEAHFLSFGLCVGCRPFTRFGSSSPLRCRPTRGA